MAHREGRRVAALLELWMRARRVTGSAVDSACGWSKGTLARSLKGIQPLTFAEVAAVSEVCGFPLGEFYMALAGQGGGKPPEGEGLPGKKKVKREEFTPDLESRVRGIARKVYEDMERAKAKKESPKKEGA